MSYRVAFTPHALADLSALDPAVAARLIQKIQWLGDHFEKLVPELLGGRFKDLLKLRVGDWRVLYTVDRPAAVLTIHVIAHRSKVYKL